MRLARGLVDRVDEGEQLFGIAGLEYRCERRHLPHHLFVPDTGLAVGDHGRGAFADQRAQGVVVAAIHPDVVGQRRAHATATGTAVTGIAAGRKIDLLAFGDQLGRDLDLGSLGNRHDRGRWRGRRCRIRGWPRCGVGQCCGCSCSCGRRRCAGGRRWRGRCIGGRCRRCLLAACRQHDAEHQRAQRCADKTIETTLGGRAHERTFLIGGNTAHPVHAAGDAVIRALGAWPW
ncbi:hypothetical protein XAC2852_150083 [Xanthomonas citri pv. citri]|nr:hypothetical protein XAC2852_150083 [Xanthomonas citri pv. citri]